MTEISFSTAAGCPEGALLDEVLNLNVRAFDGSDWGVSFSEDQHRRILRLISEQPNVSADYARTGDGKLAAASIFSAVTSADESVTLWIWSLCVDPAFAGEHLGRKLVGRIIEEARKQGATGIQLQTKPGTRAERLYEGMGFKAHEQSPNPERIVLRLEQQFPPRIPVENFETGVSDDTQPSRPIAPVRVASPAHAKKL